MTRIASPVRRTLLVQMIAAAITAAPLLAAAQSLPTGATVVAGNVTFSRPAPNTLDIHQSSNSAITNWQSFSIGAGNTVQFVQPSASSVSLNRVVGNNPSEIYGNLVANGQVFLINGNGILFGRSAQVDTGGLVASTLNLSDQNFLAGNYVFSDPGNTRSVINQGTLKASNGGLLALIGHQVFNLGSMQASLGSVVLGAGGTAQLTLADNKLIKFEVQQSTLGALAQNGGLIQADGGQVILTAGARDSLLASTVNNDGIIEAQTVQGQSGHILLLSGMQAGTTHVGGTLDASASGGDGGSIETSGAHVQVADGARITTRADVSATGHNGQWLIDPTDFTIAASGGDMTGAALSTALAAGNVVIQSSRGAHGTSGDINVDDTLSWSVNTLTLNAQNNININAVLNGSGTAGLALWYGQSAVAAGNTASYNINAPLNLASTGSFQTKLGSDGSPISWTIITSLGVAGDTSGTTLQGIDGNLSGHYVLGANIDASSTSGWNSGAGFSPISINASNPFTGSFDGLNHSISNLTINLPGQGGVGLFSSSLGALIQNVGLVGGSMASAGVAGALVGSMSPGSVIRNAYATVNVRGGNYIGGLVGLMSGGSISNAYATGNVNGAGAGAIGGLVGGMREGGSISNSYATGSVSGSSQLGGLLGSNESSSVSGSYYATTDGSGATINNGGATGGLTGPWSGNANGAAASLSQLQTLGTFSAWGSSIDAQAGTGAAWRIYDGSTTPLLRSFLTPYMLTGLVVPDYDGVTSHMGNVAGFTVNSSGFSGDPQILGLSNIVGTGQLILSGGAAGSYTATVLVKGVYSTQQGYDLGVDSSRVISTADTVGSAAGDVVLPSSGLNWTSGSLVVNASGNVSAAAALNGTSLSIDANNVVLAGATMASGLTLTAAANASSSAALNSSSLDITASNVALAGGSVGSSLTVSATGMFDNSAVLSSPVATITASSITAAGIGNLAVSNSLTVNTSGSLVLPAYNLVNLTLNVGGSITENNAVNVTGIFDQQNGSWVQNSASLPAFSAHDFQLAGGSFLRVLGGDGSSTSPYQVADVYGLQGMKGFTSSNILLANNIDASGTVSWNAGAGFTPIASSGAFTGSLDGQDHVINGLTINLPGNNGTGLFGNLSNATVKNLGLTGGSIAGGSNTGVLTGTASGNSVIDNVYTATNITISGAGANSVGGLVGYLNGGSINDSHATGSITNGYEIGGLVGASNGGSISNSYATGSLTTTSTQGANQGDSFAGGLVGLMAGGSITGSYATGNLQGSAAGSLASGGSMGGLVGYVSGANINNSYATGNIDSGGVNLGGLVGTMTAGNISNAYATGNVLNGYYGTGGLIGYVNTAGAITITDSYATGAVSGYLIKGGLIGEDDTATNGPALTINNTFYATTDSAGNAINNSGTVDANIWSGNSMGTGKTYAQLQSLSTFAAWGSSIDGQGGTGSIWRIYDGDSTPLLRSFLTPLTATLQGGLGKTYDGSSASGTAGYTLSNPAAIVSGGNTVSYATSGKNAGVYSVANGNLAVTGNLYSNQAGYDISYAGSYAIAQKQLSASFTASNKIYDGTATATVSGVLDTTGVISGDAVSLSGVTGSFADKNAGVNKTVSLTGITLTGTGAGNYLVVNSGANPTATITPKQVTITSLVANNKTYDGTTVASLSNWGSVDTGIAGETMTLTHGAANFASANAANGIAITATGYGLANGSDLAGNYQLTSTSAVTTANITPATLTANLTGTISKTYDGNADAVLASGNYVLTGFVAGQGATVTRTAGSYNSANVDEADTVTANLAASDFTANSGTNFNNYVLPTTVSGTGTITPVVLTYTANSVSRTYGASNPVLSGTLTGFVNGETQATATGGALTWVTPATGTSSVGNYAVDGTGLTANHGNYVFNDAASNGAALMVTPAVLTITASDASKAYGQTLSLTGFTTSGLQNGETIGSVAESSAGTAATASVGSYAIGASNATGGTFNAGNYTISYVGGSLTVNPAALTVTANDVSKVYGQAPTLTGFTVSGLQNGETIGSVAETSVGAASTANVGSYAIDASNATGGTFNAGNYTINYVDGSLAVSPAALTVTASNANKIYGQTPTLTGFTTSGLLNGETIGSVTETSTGTSATANVGSYAIDASNATGGTFNASNYTINYVDGSLAVSPAALTVTASNASKVYGQVPTLTGFTASGLQNGESIGSVTETSAGMSATANVADGPYAISASNASGGTFNASNYKISYVDGSLAVTPATLTYTADTAGRTYGTANPVFSGTLVGFVNGETLADATTGTLAWTSSATQSSNVGSYAIEGSGLTANNGNYVFAQAADNNSALGVTPATLTYTANTASRTYGAANTAMSGVLTGFVNGDTLANATTGTLAWTTSATRTSNVGSYAIDGSGLTANNGNYVFVQAADNNSALTVTPTALTVTADSVSKVYGQTPTLGGFTSSGLQNGETIGSVMESSAGVSATAGVAGGPYAIDASHASGGTFNAGNYAISYVNGSLVVTPAALTVTASNATKVYGQTPTLTGFTDSGLQNGETIGSVMETSAGTSATSAVGSYAMSAGHAAGGTFNAGNYAITYVDGSLTVTPAPLTVTANDATQLANGTPYKGGNGVTITGFVNGENASVLGGTLTYGGSAQGALNPGSYVIAPGGLTSANYIVSFADGTLAITQTPEFAGSSGAQGAVAAVQSGTGFDWPQDTARARLIRTTGTGLIRSIGAGVRLPVGVN